MTWRFAALLVAAACSGERAAEQRAAAALPAGGHGADGAPLHVSGEGAARVLQQDAELSAHGYRYAYETENGIRAQESGSGEKGTQTAGTYSYVAPDGHTYSVSYTADENGYRAQGEHLPTPPPIPDAILKALEQNARDEAAGISDDGSYHQQQQYTSNQQYEYGGAAQAQYSQPAQYDQASQYNQAAQYDHAAAQYSQAAQSGESAQYSHAAQYNQPSPFSQAVQYNQAGQYSRAPEHGLAAQSEGANQY